MSTKTVRIQFEIPLAMAKEIEQLQREAHASTHREFFHNMLTLWRWAARRSREAKIIASIHPKKLTYNEIYHPALEHIRQNSLAENELALAGMVASTEEKHSLGGGLANDGMTVQPAG